MFKCVFKMHFQVFCFFFLHYLQWKKVEINPNSKIRKQLKKNYRLLYDEVLCIKWQLRGNFQWDKNTLGLRSLCTVCCQL